MCVIVSRHFVITNTFCLSQLLLHSDNEKKIPKAVNHEIFPSWRVYLRFVFGEIEKRLKKSMTDFANEQHGDCRFYEASAFAGPHDSQDLCREGSHVQNRS